VKESSNPERQIMTAHLADPVHNPSFTRGVFLGEIREDLVFPFPELTSADKESLTAILDSFRAWASATVDTARFDREGQFHEERLANAIIDIFLSTATLSRATWAIGLAGGADKATADIDNARIFIAMAMRRTRRALRAMERNQDARLKVLAERALETGSLTVDTPMDA
jgi:hypothetical protein